MFPWEKKSKMWKEPFLKMFQPLKFFKIMVQFYKELDPDPAIWMNQDPHTLERIRDSGLKLRNTEGDSQ